MQRVEVFQAALQMGWGVGRRRVASGKFAARPPARRCPQRNGGCARYARQSRPVELSSNATIGSSPSAASAEARRGSDTGCSDRRARISCGRGRPSKLAPASGGGADQRAGLEDARLEARACTSGMHHRTPTDPAAPPRPVQVAARAITTAWCGALPAQAEPRARRGCRDPAARSGMPPCGVAVGRLGPGVQMRVHPHQTQCAARAHGGLRHAVRVPTARGMVTAHHQGLACGHGLQATTAASCSVKVSTASSRLRALTGRKPRPAPRPPGGPANANDRPAPGRAARRPPFAAAVASALAHFC